MKNLYQLQTFVTVISEGSMTAAADKLYLTQPAVSQQIRNLEEDLGVEILVRGVRQIKATPQGEVLFEHAKKILQLVQQAEIAIKSIGAELKGVLRIGTLNSIGIHLMSPVVSRLMRHNPELSLKIEYAKGDELVKAYKKGLFDVLIMPDSENEFSEKLENSEKKFLFKEEMWLIAPGKEAGFPSQIHFKDLGSRPYVSFQGEFPSLNRTLADRSQQSGIQLQPVFESANVGTLKRVIESNLGWGFLPAHSIKKQVRSGRLSRVHIKDFDFELDFMYYSKKNSENKMLNDIFYQVLSQSDRSS
ncbi:MAG: LysR family transcriptional regulator [Bdellovibrionia bacterium]